MIGFLFWNISGKSLQTQIANLVCKLDTSVILLAECDIKPTTLLNALNGGSAPQFHFVPNVGCQKITILTRFPPKFFAPVDDMNRITIRRLSLPGTEEILVAAMHFLSKVNWTEDDQLSEMIKMSAFIRETEKKEGHTRTLLVGDLNMNPFERGIVNADALHGVMSRDIAKKGSRTVQGTTYPFFYNPMWGLFGDLTSGPAGTHYHQGTTHRVYFWNIYDQVLIRPALLPRFDQNSLQILASDGNLPLVSKNGLPDAKSASDHLPIYFRMTL